MRTSARWITIQPIEEDPHEHPVLYLDRINGGISTKTRKETSTLAEPDKEEIIFGIVGTIQLLLDQYVIIIRKRQQVCSVGEGYVFKAQLEIVPVRGWSRLKKMEKKEEVVEESWYLNGLRKVVGMDGYYYSHEVDLTRSMQSHERFLQSVKKTVAKPMITTADPSFLWNRFIAFRLEKMGISSWVAPLILGFVGSFDGLINEKAVKLTLISRRGADRPGLRYTVRGADIKGHVANFVETEQIVSHGDTFVSFVQVRGSAPVLWAQRAALAYKPIPTLKNVDAGGKGSLGQTAFESHFKRLSSVYGPVTAVSLIETDGREGGISKELEKCADIMKNDKVRFFSWNFHMETNGMKYEFIETKLLEKIKPDLKRYGVFTFEGESRGVTSEQDGVLRLNCIDSLDRTNVVQSVIAHFILDEAVNTMGVVDRTTSVDGNDLLSVKRHEKFESSFKHLWADNADAISKSYAGSGALKTDFTRTGKRSRKGQVMDGVNSAIRYIQNNFFDGNKQDGLDLMLGVVKVNKSSSGARDLSVIRKDEALSVGEKAMVIAVPLLCCCGAFLLQSGFRWWIRWLGCGICAISAASILTGIVEDGAKYTNRPKLNGTS